MKDKLILFLLLFTVSLNSLFSQSPPEGTKHIKYTDAVIYQGKDTLEYKQSVTFYDSTWKVLSNTNTLAAVLSEGTVTVTVIDTRTKKMYSDIDAEGDTTSSIVYLYDDQGNRTDYYQIRSGDTINKQRRTYDSVGNNLTLWNHGESGYYLRFEAEYDDSNNVVKTIWYDESGANTETEITTYDYQKGTIKTFKERPGYEPTLSSDIVIKDGIRTSKILNARVGINYGITIRYEKGGYSEMKKNGDNLEWLKIYNKKGELTTSVIIRYESYP